MCIIQTAVIYFSVSVYKSDRMTHCPIFSQQISKSNRNHVCKRTDALGSRQIKAMILDLLLGTTGSV